MSSPRTQSLPGHRKFVWFESKKRRPSDYESYTIGQQSSPDRWLDVDWPVRFDDGRAPFTEDSTAIRCAKWEDYRDPAEVWQRPFVSRVNQEEQTLATLVHEALQDGAAENINPAWRREVLETVSLDGVRSEGYAFQIEMKYRAARAGFALHEIPIVFTDRRVGQSKMSWRVTFEAVIRVWTMRFGRGS